MKCHPDRRPVSFAGRSGGIEATLQRAIRELDESFAGKRLRIEFCDGELAEVQLHSVTLPNKYDNTPESCGIIYELISTNRPRQAPKGAAFWSRLDELKNIEVIDD
jgi:hypothetical protein